MALTLTLTRSLLLCHRLPIPISRRLLSSLSIIQPPPLPSVFFSHRSLPSVFPSTPTCFTSIRRCIHSKRNPYSVPPDGFKFSYVPDIRQPSYFIDYDHWMISMDSDFGGFTEQQIIDFYIQTLAKVLGSEEEAKNSIYYVSCRKFFGFACEIDEETCNKLKSLPGVAAASPEFDLDGKDKQYWDLPKWKQVSRSSRSGLMRQRLGKRGEKGTKKGKGINK